MKRNSAGTQDTLFVVSDTIFLTIYAYKGGGRITKKCYDDDGAWGGDGDMDNGGK